VEPRTHLELNPRLGGRVAELAEGMARVELETTGEMAVDGLGLVHGGFVFGLADYAAMLAVNQPNVVLAAAEVRFLKPVIVGDRLTAVAHCAKDHGRANQVEVTVERGGETIMQGRFSCVVPDRHVLED
jgi:uncharacterized protein (TIGR00369 family)